MNGMRLAAGIGALAVLVALGAWWVAVSQRADEPSATPGVVDAVVSETVPPAAAEPEAVTPPAADTPVPAAASAGTVPLTEAEFLAIAEQAARGDAGPAAAGGCARSIALAWARA